LAGRPDGQASRARAGTVAALLGREHLGRHALAGAHGAVDEAVHHRRRLGAGPMDAPDGLAEKRPELRQDAGAQCAMKQPRVHSSSAQFCST
jgi:hypothetical protein